MLRSGPLWRCYEVTVEEDGWRLCNLSTPSLLVRAGDEPEEASRWGCGNTQSRYTLNGLEDPPPDWQTVVAAEVGAAPEGCRAAIGWFKSYLQSLEQAMRDGRASLVSNAADASDTTATFAHIGHYLEQGGPRTEAVRDSCSDDQGIDLDEHLGAVLTMTESEMFIEETYKDLVEACITHGEVDCGVLAPTAKRLCEEDSVDESVFVLDQDTVDMFGGLSVGGLSSFCSLK